MKQDKTAEAIKHLKEAVRLEPNYAVGHLGLGKVFLQQGMVDDAIKEYEKAVRLDPYNSDTSKDLGIILYLHGSAENALVHLERAIELNPNLTLAHYFLGLALKKAGRAGEAIKHFKEALELNPNWINPMNELAILFATRKEAAFYNPKESVKLAEWACRLTNYQNPELLDTLAVAYAADGRFGDAVSTAEKALSLARTADKKELIKRIQEHLQQFKIKVSK